MHLAKGSTGHMMHFKKALKATDNAEDAGKLRMSSNQSRPLKQKQKRLRGFENLVEVAGAGRRHKAVLARDPTLLQLMQSCMQTGYAQQQ